MFNINMTAGKFTTTAFFLGTWTSEAPFIKLYKNVYNAHKNPLVCHIRGAAEAVQPP